MTIASIPAVCLVIAGILGMVGQGLIAWAAILIAGLLMLFA